MTKGKKGKSKSHNQLTKTRKTGILKGVGKYKNGVKRTNALRGRGGFFEDAGKAAGSWLGSKAGGFLSKLFGVGSYTVTKNTLMAQASDPPIVSNTIGATRIQHREYIQDISGSTAFNLTSFPINPGLSTTFPWLAAVGNCFEEYILHGIIFEFKSTSATALNSTNTALGTVIMATEYNALHGNFVGKRDMENYVYSTSCSPDTSALHPVECARDVNVLSELYIRNAPPALPTDLRFSDLGNFQIATVGMQASAVIGELWVSYDVELIKPRLPDAITSVAPSHYVYDQVLYPSSTVPTNTALFGTGFTWTALGSGYSNSVLKTNTVTFTSNGRYIVMIDVLFNAVGTAPTSSTAVANGATQVSMFMNNGVRSSSIATYSGTNTDKWQYMTCVDVNFNSNSAPTLTYTLGTLPGTIVAGDLLIVPIPSGFQSRITLDDLDSIRNAINLIRVSQSEHPTPRDRMQDSDYDQKDGYVDVPQRSPTLSRTSTVVNGQKPFRLF